jgi:hypothetical protein
LAFGSWLLAFDLATCIALRLLLADFSCLHLLIRIQAGFKAEDISVSCNFAWRIESSITTINKLRAKGQELRAASLLIFPHIFTITKTGKNAPHRMDIGFSSCHAPVFVTCLWTNFQTIDFRQDTKRKKLFDLKHQ